MLVNVVLVVGLYTFAGNSGVLSFGHMSFMAIGAYATALVTIPLIQKAFLLAGPAGLSRERGAADPGRGAIVVGLLAALFAAVIACADRAGATAGGVAGDVRGAGDRPRGGEQLGRGHARQPDDDRRADQHDDTGRDGLGGGDHRRSPTSPALEHGAAAAGLARGRVRRPRGRDQRHPRARRSPSCSAASSSGSAASSTPSSRARSPPTTSSSTITFLTIAMLVIGGTKSARRGGRRGGRRLAAEQPLRLDRVGEPGAVHDRRTPRG